jgi:hypothetical protein
MPGFVNYKKGCTRLAGASDKVYQLLSHGRWFSPGTSASSTTKTGRHDIAEMLLIVALNTNKSINQTKRLNPIYILRPNKKLGPIYVLRVCLEAWYILCVLKMSEI